MQLANRECQLHLADEYVVLCDEIKAAQAKAEAEGTAEAYMELGITYRKQMMMKEAVLAYSEGLTRDPFHVLLYRHRGHAYVNLRRYQEAAADFELGLRIDPKNWDCWYHLALSYFLMEDYARAEKAYQGCLAVSDTPARKIAPTDWYYMTLMHLGKTEEALKALEAVPADLSEVGDSAGYYDRVLVYKGVKDPAEVIAAAEKLDDHMYVTYCYGIARYYMTHGEEEKGVALLKQLHTRNTLWSGFAEQATERDLKKMNA